MDPATKELVAAAIRYVTRNQASVIMTSHSVADCESLCSRVGILVRGGYKCIGTPQYLKHRWVLLRGPRCVCIIIYKFTRRQNNLVGQKFL